MRLAREGFAANNHRRGVIPLVTLVNLSIPKTLTKSLKIVALIRSECNSATPLTFLDPMIARKAILTDCGFDSSIIDTRANNSRSYRSKEIQRWKYLRKLLLQALKEEE